MAVRSVHSFGRIFRPSYNFRSIHCLRSCIAVEQIRFRSRLSNPSEVEIKFNFRLSVGFSNLLILWRLVLISFWCKMRKTIGGIINLVSVINIITWNIIIIIIDIWKINITYFSTGQAPRSPNNKEAYEEGSLLTCQSTSAIYPYMQHNVLVRVKQLSFQGWLKLASVSKCFTCITCLMSI